jgi:hypothetical protein
MSKIGVSVGEDFPVDEETHNEEDGPCCGHGDARREAWRKFRHHMHAEWHARRAAMRDAFTKRDDVEAIHDLHARHLHHFIIGGLALAGLAALLAHLHHRD